MALAMPHDAARSDTVPVIIFPAMKWGLLSILPALMRSGCERNDVSDSSVTPAQILELSSCFIFEGTDGPSSISGLKALARVEHSPPISFFPIRGGDHFNVLAPFSRLIAEKIKADGAKEGLIRFSEQELAAAMRR